MTRGEDIKIEIKKQLIKHSIIPYPKYINIIFSKYMNDKQGKGISELVNNHFKPHYKNI